MKTSHSSLLADIGLSEIELDRLGIKFVEREEYDPEISEICRRTRNINPVVLARCTITLYPFKGCPWYNDVDVLKLHGMREELGPAIKRTPERL